MGKSDQVYELVQALSRSEKRYFKLYLNHQMKGGNDLHAELFDLLVKQKKYNLDDIRKRISGNLSASKLALLKTHLKSQILKSLRIYHQKESPIIQIREQLDFAEILLEKNQLGLAQQSLQKAKDLAKKYHHESVIDEVISREVPLLRIGRDTSKIQYFLENEYFEALDSRKTIELRRTFEMLEVKVFSFFITTSLYIRSKVDLQRINTLVNVPELKMPEADVPDMCRKYYHSIWSYYYVATDDEELAAHHILALLKRLREGQQFFHEGVSNYLSQLMWCVSSASVFKDSACYLLCVDELQRTFSTPAVSARSSLLIENKKLEANIMHLGFLVGKKRYEEAELQLAEIKRKMGPEHNLKISRGESFRVSYITVFLHIKTRNFKQALKEINLMLKNPNLKFEIYLQLSILFANIIVHYELGNQMLVGNLVDSTARVLRISKLNYAFEAAFLQFAKNVLAKEERQHQLIHFQAFKEQLDGIYQSPLERTVELYFPCREWVCDVIERQNSTKTSPGH